MKKIIVSAMIAFMTISMLGAPSSAAVSNTLPVIAAEKTAVNSTVTTDCYVVESDFDAAKAAYLYPGCTFAKNPKLVANKYSSTDKASDLKLWAVMKVSIPVATFTLSDGSTIKHEIADPVSWNSGWQILYTNESSAAYLGNAEPVTYILGYKTTLSGVNSSGAGTETSTIFDSMKVPDTLNGKKVTEVNNISGAVIVKGYVIPDNGYSDVNDAYTRGSDTATESGDTISNDDDTDIGSQTDTEKLNAEITIQNKVIEALKTRIEAQKPVGDAQANNVISGKTFSNNAGSGIKGTMPNYNTAFDETKTGYKGTSIPPETGIVRNANGTITIKTGYHTNQVVQAASGDAQTWQVLNGVTYSNKTGPKTGTMQTITAGSSNANSDLKIQDGKVSVTTYKYTGDNTVSRALTTEDVKNIITTTPSLTATAGQRDVLSGKTFYGTNGTKQTGTMTNHGSVNFSPSSASDYSSGSGYYSGIAVNSTDVYNAGYAQGVKDAVITLETKASSLTNWSTTNYYYQNTTGKTETLYLSYSIVMESGHNYKQMYWNLVTNGTITAAQATESVVSGSTVYGGRGWYDPHAYAWPIRGTAIITLSNGQYVNLRVHDYNNPVSANGTTMFMTTG